MHPDSLEIKCVIVSSDEPWCDVWHTQLHYANQLSKYFNVIFLGPPKPWKLSNLFFSPLESYSVSKNLTVVSYSNLLPSAFGKLSLWINDKYNEIRLLRKWKDFTFDSKMIFWHFDPFRSYFLFRSNKRCLHVFHVIDPIAGLHLDKELATTSDLTIVTSPKFLEHYRNLSKNVIQIGQGVDLDTFQGRHIDVDPGGAGLEVSKDSILLLGTLSNEIDFRLITQLPDRTGRKVVIIGPDKITKEKPRELFNSMLATKDIHWLGPMKPDDFINHLKVCAVGIIAYENNGRNNNNLRSPLKAISYLAAGKCIVSNIDCEIPALTDKAVYMVNDENDFVRRINECCDGKLFFDSKSVHEYLQSIEYRNLLKIIFSKLHVTFPAEK